MEREEDEIVVGKEAEDDKGKYLFKNKNFNIFFFFSGRLTGETEEEREEDEIVVGKEAAASLR